MSSEAKQYWQYSRECNRQALQAKTPDLRDQLLDLAREAAVREEINAKVGRAGVAQNEPTAVRHG
jgi:hypothetical protein